MAAAELNSNNGVRGSGGVDCGGAPQTYHEHHHNHAEVEKIAAEHHKHTMNVITTMRRLKKTRTTRIV